MENKNAKAEHFLESFFTHSKLSHLQSLSLSLSFFLLSVTNEYLFNRSSLNNSELDDEASSDKAKQLSLRDISNTHKNKSGSCHMSNSEEIT